jgi:hypothetical protein
MEVTPNGSIPSDGIAKPRLYLMGVLLLLLDIIIIWNIT